MQPRFTDLDTPVVIIDSDRVDANVRRMAQIAAGANVALRPHAKSHKMPRLAQRQLAAGAAGITVAKVGEAEVFAAAGIADILIAYPVIGERKWQRVCDLTEHARITVSVDSEDAVRGLGAAAAARNLVIPLMLELDTGFGRCGVGDAAALLRLARIVDSTAGVEIYGVMSFAGHSYGMPLQQIAAVATDDAERLVAAAELLRDNSFEVRSVSVGGTPTALAAAGVPGVTEIRPGTYIFSDRDQVELGWGSLGDCALTVATSVVSRPAADRAIIDAGSKAFSSDTASHAAGWGVVLDHPEIAIRSLTEEHGILSVPAADGPAIGDVLRVIPNHACGTLNMHDSVLVAEGGKIVDEWEVEARGKLR